jgi:hypothetical protein
MLVPTWHVIVADIHGNAIGELTNMQQRQFFFPLNDVCTASFRMDAMDPQAEMVIESETDLMLWRDEKLMYRGRFGATTDTLGSPMGSAAGGEPDQHTVQFSAADYRGMLGYRFVADPSPTNLGNTVYTNMDQGQIAWSMINTAESRAAGAFGITQGLVPASVARTYTATAGSLVGQDITDIGNMDQGFDWEIDPYLKFNMWPIPSLGRLTKNGRGSSQGMTLVYGDNVMACQRSFDATQYANYLRYTGGTPSGAANPLTAYSDIVSADLYEATFALRGRWEGIDSNTNLMEQASVTAAALDDLVVKAAAVPAYQLSLTPGWWDPSQLWLGDIVRVIIDHGRLTDDLTGRVTEIDIFIDDDAGGETAIVTVGPRIGSILRRMISDRNKLNQMAKMS